MVQEHVSKTGVIADLSWLVTMGRDGKVKGCGICCLVWESDRDE